MFFCVLKGPAPILTQFSDPGSELFQEYSIARRERIGFHILKVADKYDQ